MDDLLTEFDSLLFDTLSKSANRVFFYYADIKKFISRWSKSAVDYFGLPGEILSPASIWEKKIHPDDLDEYNKNFEDLLNHVTPYHNCEYRITNAKGEYVWVNCRGCMTYDENGAPDFFAGYVTNLGTMSRIDSVTGLWTNHVFRSDVSSLLESRKSGAIIQIDIRDFKRINSKYGFDFGDIVLYRIGQIICNLCEKNEKVYRIEGTQYAVVSEGGDAKSLALLKNKIAKQLDELSINGTVLHIDISCGATLFPKDGQFIDQIQNNLSYALSNAKQCGARDIVFYSDELFEQRNRMMRLNDALRDSITNNFRGFRVVLQPIIDPKTGELHSAEVLLRWSNENFPNIGPMEFVPFLEQSGDIIDVGKWIIDTSFEYVSKWNKDNHLRKLPHININFSYVQFTDSSLLDYIISECDKYNLPRSTLIAELTESCRIEYSDKLAKILQSFRDEGIIIALDDFGTGYASLMILKDIPADIIKLDHTMTRTIADRPKDKNLVEFIITYCNKIGIDVCTEGVETKEILDIVETAGTKYIQGYYYDKPLEVDDFFKKYLS